jgi:hypothetical protein
VTASTQLRQGSTHPWDSIFVLRDYELRDDIALADTSRFAEDVWELAPAGHQRHVRALSLPFTAIPAPYRLLAKEVFCAVMAMPLPPGEDRLAVATIQGEFVELKRLFTWLDAERGAPRLAELTGEDLADYAAYLRATFRTSASSARCRSSVRRIWRFRSVLPGDRLPFDPAHVDGWSHPKRQHHGENRTDRLPEQVMGPLIVWATRLVDDFAPDILAMTREWAQLRHNHDAVPKTQGQRRPDLLPALEKLLARHVEEHRPLPGRKGVINYALLRNVLTCSRSTLTKSPSYVRRIEDTANVVSVDNDTYVYTAVTAHLDDQPWLEKISNEYGDQSLPVLARLLQIACYILVSFYSGMRDSEVKHLNRGCLRIERDAEGARLPMEG